MGMVSEGRRVVLRPMREEDLEAVEALYGEAVKASGIPHPLPLSRERERGAWPRGALVVERAGEPQPIGIVEDDVSDGCLAVAFIALAKAYRGWGYGSEAVRLLESDAVLRGVAEHFRAEVDVRNGLGLYFWLRLGYRPLAARAEERARGVVSMVREAGQRRLA